MPREIRDLEVTGVVRGARKGVAFAPQTTATTAADLATLAAGQPGFFGRPFVRGALQMRGAPALAGDLALLFGGHRRKSPALFPSHRRVTGHCVCPAAS